MSAANDISCSARWAMCATHVSVFQAIERISPGVADCCPAEQGCAPVGLQRLIGIDTHIQQARTGWLVVILQAVHQRAALDGEAATNGVDARIGSAQLWLHLKLEHDRRPWAPGPGQGQVAIWGHSLLDRYLIHR